MFYEAALRAFAAIDEAEASAGLNGAQVRLTAPLTLAQSRLIAMLAAI